VVTGVLGRNCQSCDDPAGRADPLPGIAAVVCAVDTLPAQTRKDGVIADLAGGHDQRCDAAAIRAIHSLPGFGIGQTFLMRGQRKEEGEAQGQNKIAFHRLELRTLDWDRAASLTTHVALSL
jgi:hypothetical protein